MKRIFLSMFTLLLIVTCGYAQKSNVSKAKNKALATENPDFAGAKEAIQAALINEETKALASTVWTAGLVYEKSADAASVKKDQELNMGNDAIKAYKYYLNAYELDKLPNAKGKIKPKYANKIRISLTHMYKSMMYVNYAIKKYEAEEYEAAIEAFEIHTSIPNLSLMLEDPKFIIVKDSTYYQIVYYTAMCAWTGKINDKAIELYSSLKDKDYNENTVYQSLCQIYESEKDTVNFVKTLQEGIAKFPNEFYYLGNLINYYVFSGQSALATEYLTKAIQNDPNNAQLYNVKGSMLELQNDIDGAIQNFEKAIELNSTLADAWANKARVLYNRAIKAEADANAIRNLNLADIEIAKAKELFKNAIPFFEKAVELNDKDVTILKTLRALYYRFLEEDSSYQIKYDEINNKIKSL